MALIKISSDGAEFEIADDVARDDRHLREALAPFYPELANAEINRSEEDGKLIVMVTKRAGTKGAGISDVLLALVAAPEEINPALVLQRKLMRIEEQGKLDLRKILRLQPEIRRAVDEGMKQIKEHSASLKLLREGTPVAGRSIPSGF
ncbi:MAG: hypothetical protein MOB07_25715 [Acidobacteria bacterium]|nr:hypothetical protein [Acidobacteriota bacterium]